MTHDDWLIVDNTCTFESSVVVFNLSLFNFGSRLISCRSWRHQIFSSQLFTSILNKWFHFINFFDQFAQNFDFRLDSFCGSINSLVFFVIDIFLDGRKGTSDLLDNKVSLGASYSITLNNSLLLSGVGKLLGGLLKLVESVAEKFEILFLVFFLVGSDSHLGLDGETLGSLERLVLRCWETSSYHI